jgi:hypothetical protein
MVSHADEFLGSGALTKIVSTNAQPNLAVGTNANPRLQRTYPCVRVTTSWTIAVRGKQKEARLPQRHREKASIEDRRSRIAQPYPVLALLIFYPLSSTSILDLPVTQCLCGFLRHERWINPMGTISHDGKRELAAGKTLDYADELRAGSHVLWTHRLVMSVSLR